MPNAPLTHLLVAILSDLKAVILRASIALALALSTTTLYADIYKWEDANGNVVYGDKPAGNTDATLIKSDQEITRENEGFGISNKHRASQNQFLKTAEERRIQQKKADAKAKKSAEKQAQRCAHLQARLKQRARVNRLYEYTEDGNVRYLSDEERQASDQRLKQKTQKACDNSA